MQHGVRVEDESKVQQLSIPQLGEGQPEGSCEEETSNGQIRVQQMQEVCVEYHSCEGTHEDTLRHENEDEVQQLSISQLGEHQPGSSCQKETLIDQIQ